MGTEDMDEIINDDEAPVFYRKVCTMYAISGSVAKFVWKVLT